MFVQRLVMLSNSDGPSFAKRKGVSVVANEPAAGPACAVVPQATIPAASLNPLTLPATAALFVQDAPAKSELALVATILMTTELGRTPVRVLLIKSLLTDREINPFGVIRQEQHDTNCSSGEKA